MSMVPASQENTAVAVGANNTYPFADPIFTQFNVQQYYTQSGVVAPTQMFDVVAPESDAEKGVGHTKAEK